MPAQKRPSPETDDDGDEAGSLQQNLRRRHRRRPRLPAILQPLGHDGDDDEDFEGIDPAADLPEHVHDVQELLLFPAPSVLYMVGVGCFGLAFEVAEKLIISVDLEAVREDVQCGICLGILKKTLAVMGCMHRFCTECIDKELRAGKKECPTVVYIVPAGVLLERMIIITGNFSTRRGKNT